MKTLYKTTLVIWSDEDPRRQHMEIADIAKEATVGLYYCSRETTERVEDATKDPDWDGTEFFGGDDDADADDADSRD